MTQLDDKPLTGLQVQAQFAANIGSLATEMKAARQARVRLAQCIHPFSVPPNQIAISASAGTLSQPNLYGPQMSNYWDIHRIAVTGFTAGTVTVYLNQNGADIMTVFNAAGVATFGKAQILIGGNDNLIFVAASITGQPLVAIGGVEIAASAIGDYLI